MGPARAWVDDWTCVSRPSLPLAVGTGWVSPSASWSVRPWAPPANEVHGDSAIGVRVGTAGEAGACHRAAPVGLPLHLSPGVALHHLSSPSEKLGGFECCPLKSATSTQVRVWEEAKFSVPPFLGIPLSLLWAWVPVNKTVTYATGGTPWSSGGGGGQETAGRWLAGDAGEPAVPPPPGAGSALPPESARVRAFPQPSHPLTH